MYVYTQLKQFMNIKYMIVIGIPYIYVDASYVYVCIRTYMCSRTHTQHAHIYIYIYVHEYMYI